MRKMNEEERKSIGERMKKGTFKFVGFISEESIKLNKNKPYLYFITDTDKTSDKLDIIISGCVRNVYVYKEVKNVS